MSIKAIKVWACWGSASLVNRQGGKGLMRNAGWVHREAIRHGLSQQGVFGHPNP